MYSTLSPLLALPLALAHLPAFALAQEPSAAPTTTISAPTAAAIPASSTTTTTTSCGSDDSFCTQTSNGFNAAAASELATLSAVDSALYSAVTTVPSASTASGGIGPFLLSYIMEEIGGLPESQRVPLSSVLGGPWGLQNNMPTGALSTGVSLVPTGAETGAPAASGRLPENGGAGNGTRVMGTPTPTPTPSQAAAGRVAGSSEYMLVAMAGVAAGFAGVAFGI